MCSSARGAKMTSIIILNWNGWKDTIECLESVFRLDYPDFRVIVCDNNSHNDSLDKIKAWADGRLPASQSNPELAYLTSPAVPKPIPYRELNREESESGGAFYDARLVLIQNGLNLGFAGGTNVGLRYALGDKSCGFFWMLNNDTVVDSGALRASL